MSVKKLYDNASGGVFCDCVTGWEMGISEEGVMGELWKSFAWAVGNVGYQLL